MFAEKQRVVELEGFFKNLKSMAYASPEGQPTTAWGPRDGSPKTPIKIHQWD